MTPAAPLNTRTLTLGWRAWWLACLALLPWLGGCAGWAGTEPPRVHVVGLERISSEGFELRFNLKLRVQNPNSHAVSWEGIAIDLDVNGRPLASGVSADHGSVPGFGEAIVSLPVSVNAVAAVRQMLGLLDGTPRGDLPYAVRGRLGGGPMGGLRFRAEGTLRLPG
ncbi:MAG: LEA type 2 family protein [Rubrivivax sp.]